MKSTFSRFALVLIPLTIVGCEVVLEPEWSIFYSHAQEEESRVEWLDVVAVDTDGDIVIAGDTIRLGSNRQQNVLLVKHDANGNLDWAVDYDVAQGAHRSDDNVTDMVLDGDGNAYVGGIQYKVIDSVQSYGSFLMKFDRYGDVVWAKEVSPQNDLREVELVNDKLYITGHSTQVFDLDGQLLLQIDHADSKAWDVEVDEFGSIYVAGHRTVSKYSESGDFIWQVEMPGGLTGWAALLVNGDGSVVAAHKILETEEGRVVGISASGEEMWVRTFRAASQSFGLPGPPLLAHTPQNDVVFVFSNEDGRNIVNLNDAGTVLWQVSNTKGTVQDLVVRADGSIYVVGNGTGEKFDPNGSYVNETNNSAATQLTTGSLAIDGNNLYIGYSARKDGSFKFNLTKYID